MQAIVTLKQARLSQLGQGWRLFYLIKNFKLNYSLNRDVPNLGILIIYVPKLNIHETVSAEINGET